MRIETHQHGPGRAAVFVIDPHFTGVPTDPVNCPEVWAAPYSYPADDAGPKIAREKNYWIRRDAEKWIADLPRGVLHLADVAAMLGQRELEVRNWYENGLQLPRADRTELGAPVWPRATIQIWGERKGWLDLDVTKSKRCRR